MASKSKADEEVIETVSTFSKEQILSADKYSNRKDILGVLLEDGKEYSFEQVDALMDQFYER